MKLLIISGANLNMLGKRDPFFYGSLTLAELETEIADYAAKKGIDTEFFQSNCEGEIIDKLHSAFCDGVILNAGAYSHYSYAIRDAVECCGKKVADVHLSDVLSREPFRRSEVLKDVCAAFFSGKKVVSYFDAIDFFETLSARTVIV